MDTQIIAAVIGGFLAAGTGWFLQNRAEASRIRKLRELWIVGISEDLNSAIDMYQQVMEGWQQSRVVWFNLLNELNDSRSAYERNRDFVVFIDNVDLRRNILKYYRKSANVILQLRNTQQRQYDLRGELMRVLQDIQQKNPGIAYEEAARLVLESTQPKQNELEHIDQQLPQLVNSLEGLKGDARQILSALNKSP